MYACTMTRLFFPLKIADRGIHSTSALATPPGPGHGLGGDMETPLQLEWDLVH